MAGAGHCSASLLLVARTNPRALLAQLESLAEAGLPDDVELIAVADGATPEVVEVLRLLSGRVRVLATAAPAGRRASLTSAAEAAEGEICVVLGSLARPRPGFLEPLLAAVRDGAGLAAPVLATSAGAVHGYRLEHDRSLRPLREPARPDALALDCLAGPRARWLSAARAFDHWRDLYEVSLAHVARGFGPLEVATGSEVAREGLGPPMSVIVRGEDPSACIEALVEDGVVGEVLPEAEADRARHEVLAYVDSATRPGPGWADHLAEAFADPAVGLARGPIRGLWPEGSDPNRIPLRSLDTVGIVDRGDADGDLPPAEAERYPNWAVRRGEEELRACRYASQAAVGTVLAPERAHDPLLAPLASFRAGAEDIRLSAAHESELPALGAALSDVAPLPASLSVDDLFARVVDGPGAAQDKLARLRSLGRLAALTAELGLDEARLPSGATLRVQARHAEGEVQWPPVSGPGSAGAARVEEPPQVSCVIPVFNLERYVGATIQSVLDQEYPAGALDIVVVDDGSTDGTAEVCAGFGERIRYVRQENAGVIAAVDRGVREARGDLIAFLDADDQWLPDKTRRQVEWLAAHREVGLLYGDMELIDAHDRVVHGSFWGSAGVVPHRGHVFGDILRWNFVTTGSMMVRASLREAFCPMPEASPWQDWGIAAAVARVAALDYLPDPLFRYRTHEGNHALGAEGERLARAHEKDLRFRRAMLASLAEGELGPYDLREAFHAFLANADRLARTRGVAREDVLPIEQAEAVALRAEGVEALAAGRLAPGFHLLVASLVRDPRDELAYSWFEAAGQRLRRCIDGARPGPLAGPADPHAVDRLLSDCAGATVVGHVQELVEDDELLRSFAGAFGADQATLVAYAPDSDAGELFGELAAAVGRAGLDAPDAPDVVLFDPAGSPALEERLAARAAALLTRRAETSALGSLRRWDGAPELLPLGR